MTAKTCIYPVIKLVLMSSCLALSFFSASAQEEKEENKPFAPQSSVSLVISHAHIFEGDDADNKKSFMSLPAWGINYNYQFAPRWAVGLHTDIIIESFKVIKKEGEGLESDTTERSYPIAPAIMFTYLLNHHWSFLLGAGEEFAKEEDLFLVRAGVEYKAEISRNWEVFGAISYDFRFKAYDDWNLGIGIARAF